MASSAIIVSQAPGTALRITTAGPRRVTKGVQSRMPIRKTAIQPIRNRPMTRTSK